MQSRVRRPTLSRATRRAPWAVLLFGAATLSVAVPAASSVAAAFAADAHVAPVTAASDRLGAPRIIGGTVASIRDVPWQVSLSSRGGIDGGFDCGGAILDASTIVTAAHCVDGVALGADPTDGGLGVTAGRSDLTKPTAGDVFQHRTVVDARIHPAWTPDEVRTSGDLAIVELDVPLVLDDAAVAAVALPPDAPLGEDPAMVGVAAIASGYGRQSPALVSTGALFKLSTSVVAPGVCGGVDNAAALCARTPSGAACSGDSGGPLVSQTTPPLLIGIVSNGPVGCPAGEGESYVNLATPENRRFLAGDAHPPIAPRRTSDLVFGPVGGTAVLVGHPVVCSAAFTGGAAVRWTIADNAGNTLAVVRGGTGATYWPTDADLGRTLSCQVNASNAGGVSVAGPISTADAVTRPRNTPQVRVPDPSTFTLEGAALSATAAKTVRRGQVVRARVELSKLFGVAESAKVCVRLGRSTPKCLKPAVKSLQGASYGFKLRIPKHAKVGSRQRLTASAVLGGRDASGRARQVSRRTSLKLRVSR